jgi:hypothetical protein
MTAAAGRVAVAAASLAAGIECAELFARDQECVERGTPSAHVSAADRGESGPPGGGLGAGVTPQASGKWSRCHWTSTAALTIGRPPRAPRSG